MLTQLKYLDHRCIEQYEFNRRGFFSKHICSKNHIEETSLRNIFTPQNPIEQATFLNILTPNNPLDISASNNIFSNNLHFKQKNCKCGSNSHQRTIVAL